MRKGERVRIFITDISQEGSGIGRYEGRVCFVEEAVPGDECMAEVTGFKKNIPHLRMVELLMPSSFRKNPECIHFGYCGGCRFQHLIYSSQLEWKRKQVKEVFARIGKMDLPEMQPPFGSPRRMAYRNKMDYSFSDMRWLLPEEIRTGTKADREHALGFHLPGRFDKVLDITECRLMASPSDEIRNFIRSFFIHKKIPFFNIRCRGGGPRSLILRSSRVGDFLVVLSMYEFDEPVTAELYELLCRKYPSVKGMVVYHNTKGNDSLYDIRPVKKFGMEYLEEEIFGLRFRYGPLSFFQVNVEVAEQMFEDAVRQSGVGFQDCVWDLYCGVGVLSLCFARYCRRVVGIELLSEAVEYARYNAEQNSIHHAAFYAGDVKKVLQKEKQLLEERPDILVCDPPRAGIDKHIVEHILHLLPEKIVYISCNPSTQARDAERLSGQYIPVFSRVYDMFPQTPHTEHLLVLKRKR